MPARRASRRRDSREPALSAVEARLSLRERFCEFLCGIAAGADAIGDADAAIGVAGESEAGQLLPQAFDAGAAIEMSNAVLRHGGFPFVDPGKEWLGAHADDLLQFVAYDSNNLVVSELPD